jgi:hypothetical protein
MIFCYSSTYTWPLWPSHTYCYTSSATSFSKSFQSESHSFECSQKSEAKTFQLWQSPQIEFIPTEIFTEFPNINGFSIFLSNLPVVKAGLFTAEFFKIEFFRFYSSKIEKVEPKAFEYLPNLKWISFYRNKIQSLPDRIFEKNPKLIYIDFYSNQIKSVIPSFFFQNFNNLKLVDFRGNQCISKQIGCDTCTISQSELDRGFSGCFTTCLEDEKCGNIETLSRDTVKTNINFLVEKGHLVYLIKQGYLSELIQNGHLNLLVRKNYTNLLIERGYLEKLLEGGYKDSVVNTDWKLQFVFKEIQGIQKSFSSFQDQVNRELKSLKTDSLACKENFQKTSSKLNDFDARFEAKSQKADNQLKAQQNSIAAIEENLVYLNGTIEAKFTEELDAIKLSIESSLKDVKIAEVECKTEAETSKKVLQSLRNAIEESVETRKFEMENLVNRTVGKVDSDILKMAGNFEKTVADFNATFENATKLFKEEIAGNTTMIVATNFEKTEARVEKILENLSLKLSETKTSMENERLQCRLREAEYAKSFESSDTKMKLEIVELKAKLEQQSKDNEILSLKFANEKRALEDQMEKRVQELEEKFNKKLEEVVNQKLEDFERKLMVPA